MVVHMIRHKQLLSRHNIYGNYRRIPSNQVDVQTVVLEFIGQLPLGCLPDGSQGCEVTLDATVMKIQDGCRNHSCTERCLMPVSLQDARPNLVSLLREAFGSLFQVLSLLDEEASEVAQELAVTRGHVIGPCPYVRARPPGTGQRRCESTELCPQR